MANVVKPGRMEVRQNPTKNTDAKHSQNVHSTVDRSGELFLKRKENHMRQSDALVHENSRRAAIMPNAARQAGIRRPPNPLYWKH